MISAKYTYQLIKQIHLYASLSTLVFFVMYLLTSFMMVHHDTFQPGQKEKFSQELAISPAEMAPDQWEGFLKKYQVHGRLTKETTSKSGELIREYDAPESHFKLIIAENKQSLSLETIHRNASGAFIGFHRLRGYSGPFLYLLYAFLLDLTAIALILFAITGVILWLQVLKDHKVAWMVLIAGLLYVGAVVGYLMLV